MTGRMKDFRLRIEARDEGLSARAREVWPQAADVGDEFENVVVYQANGWYVLVVDGVPQSPWLSRESMTRLLSMDMVSSVEIAEAVATYQRESDFGLYGFSGWEDL